MCGHVIAYPNGKLLVVRSKMFEQVGPQSHDDMQSVGIVSMIVDLGGPGHQVRLQHCCLLLKHCFDYRASGCTQFDHF